MVQMHGQYQGEKHCELTHGPSSSKIETDAPRDNNGKGERFSPTDLVGAALGSCVLTTMAIFAEKEGIDLKGASFEVVKEMSSSPRRIASLSLKVTLPNTVPEARREWLEGVGHACPVSRSLHPDVQIPIEYSYRD